MKVKNALFTLGLTLTLGIGVGVGLAAKQEVKGVHAANGDYGVLGIIGGATNWDSANATYKMTDNGDGTYTYSDLYLSVGDKFKTAKNNNSDWQGWWAVDNGPTTPEMKANFKSDNDGPSGNIECVTAGAYTITYYSTAYATSSEHYHLLIEAGVVQTYSVTLSVTFTSDVPDYVDIYMPGLFNGWSTDVSVSKMTRVSNTVFTYDVADVAAGSYTYKVVACYAGATVMDWNHQIDTSNQTVTIAASDDGTTKALANRTYDFATNMPQETAPEGAHVTLTFGSAVPTTVDIIYVGGLTQWGTSTAYLNAGKMTANENRTIFTWNLPDDTYTGTYAYKIVAMSKYTPATEANYDHIVYGEKGSDEQLVVDKITTEYALTANDYDLSYIGAYAFAEGFIDAMDDICGTTQAEWEVDHTGTALSNTWGNWKTIFESLTEGAKTAFGENNNSTIDQARKLYVHCVARYHLSTWTDAPAAAPRTALVFNNENTMIYVIIVAFAAISAVGVFFAIKRRKQTSK